MKKVIKIVIIFIIFAGLVAGGITLIKKRKQQLLNEKTPERPIYIVSGVIPKKDKITEKKEFLGYIKPVNTVDIKSKKPVYIKKIRVEIGQPVKKGQLLVILDDKDIKTKIENLKLDLENLNNKLSALKTKENAINEDLKEKERIYKRYLKLYKKDLLPKIEFEKSYVTYKSAQANLEEIKSNIKQLKNNIEKIQENINNLRNELTYYKIYSPTDGTIQNIILREGNLASTIKPILKIESKTYEVDINLPQDFKLSKNTKAYIQTDSKKIYLKIAGFYPYAERNLKILRTILNKKPASLTSNSNINVILEKTVEGIKLPVNAVLHLTDGTYILEYKNGKFIKVPVVIKGENKDYVIVEGNIGNNPVAIGDESKLRLLASGRKAKLITGESKNEL
ncbi:efflux RND transporter periplasmic adaptor subunit [Hydrogenothermus marinus]|uniref:RND family efflux transporter MFP subunit n=1 Tax=Hydrogenothermus marinus TaxID=133270 RepID=A0A3M0BLB5_9AQUI|nr:biotin/lipoyl-binding protein [Hydrogenothermus marinus]RMA97957.1 RND family efflux transporter MFP subunit [Hydrogenothermus marinus]